MLLIVLTVAASLLFFTSPCTQRLLFLDPGDAGRMTTGIAAGPAAAAAAEILWQVLRRRPALRPGPSH